MLCEGLFSFILQRGLVSGARPSTFGGSFSGRSGQQGSDLVRKSDKCSGHLPSGPVRRFGRAHSMLYSTECSTPQCSGHLASGPVRGGNAADRGRRRRRTRSYSLLSSMTTSFWRCGPGVSCRMGIVTCTFPSDRAWNPLLAQNGVKFGPFGVKKRPS